jgi:hypothetical protein
LHFYLPKTRINHPTAGTLQGFHDVNCVVDANPLQLFGVPPCSVGTGKMLGAEKVHKIIAALVIAAPLAMLPCVAGAKGCLKGAAVGGVVGHVAGHHAVAGAAAGCVIEHHREKMQDQAAKQKTASQNRTAGVASPAPSQ